ncbi:uncharacterized protein PRCAT00002142001 [Priceomyces carsonii]|uniref:uncharacterized protein n=1 Tax=Priceomyces carsonii TaxID=28549 RepID=UPI002EDAAD25|nr:unnamed protein product [Priceomyces carsonii]
MKIKIRLSTEVSYSVTIPDNSTVEDLRSSAQVACPSGSQLPEDFKLIYNGEKLASHYRTLESYNIGPEQDATVILMSNDSNVLNEPSDTPVPSTTTSKKVKSKKNRCSFKSCNSAPLRMVGSCSHCQGKFCAKHRLLEDHLCQGLQYCKDNAHEKNAMKLQSERTITNKV